MKDDTKNISTTLAVVATPAFHNPCGREIPLPVGYRVSPDCFFVTQPLVILVLHEGDLPALLIFLEDDAAHILSMSRAMVSRSTIMLLPGGPGLRRGVCGS